METCTLELYADSPASGKLWYIDSLLSVQSIDLPSFGQSVYVDVLKGGLVACNFAATSQSDNEAITKAFEASSNACAFIVYDDAVIITL